MNFVEFVNPRPPQTTGRGRRVSSLGPQEGRRVFREGPNFLNYVQHIFPGREKNSLGAFPLRPLVTDLGRGPPLILLLTLLSAGHWLEVPADSGRESDPPLGEVLQVQSCFAAKLEIRERYCISFGRVIKNKTLACAWLVVTLKATVPAWLLSVCDMLC